MGILLDGLVFNRYFLIRMMTIVVSFSAQNNRLVLRQFTLDFSVYLTLDNYVTVFGILCELISGNGAASRTGNTVSRYESMELFSISSLCNNNNASMIFVMISTAVCVLIFSYDFCSNGNEAENT